MSAHVRLLWKASFFPELGRHVCRSTHRLRLSLSNPAFFFSFSRCQIFIVVWGLPCPVLYPPTLSFVVTTPRLTPCPPNSISTSVS
jgi:hypothetical protein